MTYYIFKRMISIIISIAVVFTFLYMILTMAIPEYWGNLPFKENLSLAWENYKDYVSGIIKDFDFGKSSDHKDVWTLVWPKFKLSMIYNLTALAVFVPAGIILGLVAAIYKNKIADVLISTFAMVFNSIPAFLLIFFLVIYVGYVWRLLPPIAPAYSAPLGRQILGLIIPVFALSAGPTGKIAQIIRGELIEISQSDHFLLVRCKGLKRNQALIRHGLKESLVSAVPEIIPTFMMMIGFSFVVEQTYNVFGISKLLIDSLIIKGEFYNILDIDVPVVVAIGILFYAIILIASLFTDVFITFIDPRIRMVKTKKRH